MDRLMIILLIFSFVMPLSWGEESTPVPTVDEETFIRPNMAVNLGLNPFSLQGHESLYHSGVNIQMNDLFIQSRIRSQNTVREISLMDPLYNYRIQNSFTDTEYYCPYGNVLDNDTMRLLNELNGRCDQLAKENPFDPEKSFRGQLPALMSICGCYTSGTNIQSAAVPHSRTVRRLGKDKRVTIPEVANSNLDTERAYLQDLVESTQVQASFMSTDDKEVQSMSVAFHQNYLRSGSQEAERDLRRAQEKLENEFKDAGFGNTIEPLTIRDNPEVLTGNNPQSCVSRRDFAAYRQFPSDPDFYQDLASTGRFRARDWDFQKLMDKLRSITNSEGILSLSNARKHAEAGPIIRRLEFLQKNPLIKNTLASNIPEPFKEAVFRAIKDNFVSSQEGAIENGDRFRKRIMRILKGNSQFSQEYLNKEVREESRREFSRRLSKIHERVTQTHQLATGADLVALTPSFLETGISNSLPLTGERTQASRSLSAEFFRARRLEAVSRVCPTILEGNFETSFVANELERQWAIEAGAVVNPGFAGQSFDDFSQALCKNRFNPARPDEKVNYDSWIQKKCGVNEECRADRQARLREFLNEYPSSDYPKDPGPQFLNVITKVPYLNLSDDAANVAASVGAQSYQEGLRTSRKAYRGEYVVPNGTVGSLPGRSSFASGPMNSGNSVNSTVIPNAQSATTTSSQSLSGQQNFVFNPLQTGTEFSDAGMPQIYQPQANAAPLPAPAILRQQLNRSDAEIQSVRDEISALGRGLEREIRKDSFQRNDEVIARFNQQIDSLNARLETALAENRLLQEKLAEARSRQRAESVVNNDVVEEEPSSGETVRNPAASGATTTPVINVPQLPSSTAGANIMPEASASLEGNASGASSPSGNGSVNGAILSGQLARGNGEVNSSSITISNTSASEYLNLLSQTAGSEIAESLPSDVFSQIREGNTEALERFRDRLKSLPGNVVRLELREEGSSEKMELLIVKNGDQMTVTSRRGRAVAQENPEPPVTRSATLEELNNTVRSPSN